MSRALQASRLARSRQVVWVAYADMLLGLLFCFIALFLITHRYYVQATRGTATVAGTVGDAEMGEPARLSGVSVIIRESGRDGVSSSAQGWNTQTDAKGRFALTDIALGRRYAVEFMASGYEQPPRVELDLTECSDREVTLPTVWLRRRRTEGLNVLPLASGETFQTGSAALKDREKLLGEIANHVVSAGVKLRDWVAEDRDHFVYVEGFADIQGAARRRANRKLSADRAMAVAELMVHDLSFPPDRIIVVAYGEYHPLPPPGMADEDWWALLDRAGDIDGEAAASGRPSPSGHDQWLANLRRLMGESAYASDEWLTPNRRILVRPAVGYREQIEKRIMSGRP